MRLKGVPKSYICYQVNFLGFEKNCFNHSYILISISLHIYILVTLKNYIAITNISIIVFFIYP